MRFRLHQNLSALALGLLLGAAAPLRAANLSGSFSDIGTASVNDISAFGAADWAHWGYQSNPGFDHKASGGGQISNVIPVNSALIQQVSDPSTPFFSWRGGSPNSWVSSPQGQLSPSSLSAGSHFSVPAGPTVRTLK